MKKIILIIAILFTINSCCKKQDLITYCNVENPLEDLEWLKERYEAYDYENENPDNARIYYYKLYDGREIINLSFETFGGLFDCAGNSLCSYGGFVGAVCDSIYTIRDIKLSKTLAPIEL